MRFLSRPLGERINNTRIFNFQPERKHFLLRDTDQNIKIKRIVIYDCLVKILLRKS